jgi:hypothetical protein
LSEGFRKHTQSGRKQKWQFSVPRQRISQIEAKALWKLQHPSRSRKHQLSLLPGRGAARSVVPTTLHRADNCGIRRCPALTWQFLKWSAVIFYEYEEYC